MPKFSICLMKEGWIWRGVPLQCDYCKKELSVKDVTHIFTNKPAYLCADCVELCVDYAFLTNDQDDDLVYITVGQPIEDSDNLYNEQTARALFFTTESVGESHKKVIDLRNNGISFGLIARELSLSKSTVAD